MINDHTLIKYDQSSVLVHFSLCLQHQYHTKIDDQIDKTLAGMNQGLISKLMSVLEASLSKLSRYDEGSLIGSILSFTVIMTYHYVFDFIIVY